ncbi:MAG: IS30 family transposase [Candidatus Nomurabacteria bacterium]|nr:IS30 family transposase [Candidatus Nomurabacteria bacterium]MCB9810648.1 IS30 family transposase [Candidatus Nomurabacteria bacterium]MCB9810788.1 IS30 family transposase [Candidatus Nomurabacteria bacterium]MCB9810822.1 IS30 family transposase [Candidatus Nomurabacteria bacterium]MCB9810974.1 IS30 family transposase [Candidatus Nomurabacteria bacterium]
MSHKQIGPEDWPVISRMLKAGYSGVEIAHIINKDPSAVNRHIKAYGGRDRYDAREVRRKKKQARIIAMEGTRILKGVLLREVKRLLKQHYSPEQIVGVRDDISASTIYRYINERAPHLKQFLRSQKGKYRRKRGTKIREKVRERAKKRRIDERPPIIERRSRLGDWEGDTMLGRDKRVRIVTFVDRRSGYLIAYLLPKLNATLLTKLAVEKFRRIPKNKRKTATFDNGTEFSDWERFEKQTSMTVYFAYPYHSWERGTNENTNGLLRQYFPKDLDFNTITPQELSEAVRRINHRPRKRHNFKSPHQIFWK